MTDHAHPLGPDRVEAGRGAALHGGEAHALGAPLSLLADPLRARILTALLATEEMCVGDIALALDGSEDSASYALRLARSAGLAQRRSQGRMGDDRLRDGDLRTELVATIEQLRRLAAARPERAADGDVDP